MSEDISDNKPNTEDTTVNEEHVQSYLPSMYHIEERRGRVKEMMLRGVRISTMAKVLGVSYQTVRSDVEEIKSELRERYRNYDIKVGIGECADALDMLARRSSLEAEKTKNKKMRNCYLNTSIRAWVAKAHVLSDPGALPSAIGAFARAAANIDGGDYEPIVKKVIKDANSRRKLLSALNQVIKTARPVQQADIVISSSQTMPIPPSSPLSENPHHLPPMAKDAIEEIEEAEDFDDGADDADQL